MNTPPCRILIVEDDDNDFIIFERDLKKIDDLNLEYDRACSLINAQEKLKQESYDLLIIDLSLPDADASTTLAIIQAYALRIPVIVLTAFGDAKTGAQSLQFGMQDYLWKGKIDSDMLSRSIRYARERFSLSQQIEGIKVARGIANIESLADCSYVRSRNRTIIKEQKSDFFENMVREYCMILDKLVLQKMHGMDFDKIAALNVLSRRLLELKVGARDVIEIHCAAVAEKIKKLESAQYYLDAAHSFSLELMGCLLDHYREKALERVVKVG